MPDMLIFSAAQTTNYFQLQELDIQVLFLVKWWIVNNNNTGCLILFCIGVDKVQQVLNLNTVLKIGIND